MYFVEDQKWQCVDQFIRENEYFVLVDDRGDTVSEINKKYKNCLAIEINRGLEKFDQMEPDKSYNNLVVKDFRGFERYLNSLGKSSVR
jgi:hypothetical protein